MDNILNMEYSLKTTLYLVELQAKEGLQARFIRYLETYNFCNGVEYKNEVLDYLSKYNIDFVSKIVNLHKKICNKVCDLWDNKLSHIPTDSINAEMKGIKGVFDYDIYFTTRKDSQFPFTEIELMRDNDGVLEYGNRYIEDSRYWHEDFRRRCDKYYFEDSMLGCKRYKDEVKSIEKIKVR